jgi:DNA-binding transcriptional ArsR family regulator
MLADADLAAVASLMGDGNRASMLLALLGGDELPARELAARAGVSSSLASAHLGKLIDGGLLSAERRGRNRYYRLAGRHIAEAIEAMLAIAPKSTRTHACANPTRGEAIRHARTCYDHLAGELGVAVTDSLRRADLIGPHEESYPLTARGRQRLASVGDRRRRAAVPTPGPHPPLLDWTERRPHLAGSLGAINL